MRSLREKELQSQWLPMALGYHRGSTSGCVVLVGTSPLASWAANRGPRVAILFSFLFRQQFQQFGVIRVAFEHASSCTMQPIYKCVERLCGCISRGVEGVIGFVGLWKVQKMYKPSYNLEKRVQTFPI